MLFIHREELFLLVLPKGLGTSPHIPVFRKYFYLGDHGCNSRSK